MYDYVYFQDFDMKITYCLHLANSSKLQCMHKKTPSMALETQKCKFLFQRDLYININRRGSTLPKGYLHKALQE